MKGYYNFDGRENIYCIYFRRFAGQSPSTRSSLNEHGATDTPRTTQRAQVVVAPSPLPLETEPSKAAILPPLHPRGRPFGKVSRSVRSLLCLFCVERQCVRFAFGSHAHARVLCFRKLLLFHLQYPSFSDKPSDIGSVLS